MVALDCGNSSYRVVLGQYKKGKIESTLIRQIPNAMTKKDGYYYWDIRGIFRGFVGVLKEIAASGTKIDSIGICTWGVDFALFDRDGNMLLNPLCYRNVIGESVLSELNKEEKKEMFNDTGILCDRINSVYMLAGMKREFPKVLEQADKCLMIPDILNYFVTGQMVNEPSEFSTTQLMDVGTKEVSESVCEKFGIEKSLFSEIGTHGEKIGNVKKEILEEIGVNYEIPVVCVPSHDTASAVAAIPAEEKHFGFISCGTWSLIGTELDAPVKNEEVMNANLTNEVGAFGKITLLKNNAGMFIVNCLKKEYCAVCNRDVSWSEITDMAETAEGGRLMDLNAIDFFNPESMSEAVWKYLLRTKQVEGKMDWGILFRTFYESLACSYAVTISDVEKITNNIFEKLYIVGGGAASRILLELTARYTEKTVVICYGESTSMGNLAVQLKYFQPELELSDIRKIIGSSYHTENVESEIRNREVLERYRDLIKKNK